MSSTTITINCISWHPFINYPPKCLLNENAPERFPPVGKKAGPQRRCLVCTQCGVQRNTDCFCVCVCFCVLVFCQVQPHVQSCFKTFHITQDFRGGESNQRSYTPGVHKSRSSVRVHVVTVAPNICSIIITVSLPLHTKTCVSLHAGHCRIVGPQYGIWFLSHIWSQIFGGGVNIFGKFVHP